MQKSELSRGTVLIICSYSPKTFLSGFFCVCVQHVSMEESYLCGYLKIKGLTEVNFETRSDIIRLTKRRLVRSG